MSDQIASVSSTSDRYRRMGFIRNDDGSFTRGECSPEMMALNAIIPVSSYAGHQDLLVKDIPINQSKNTCVRVFLPRKTIESSTQETKLPLMIYIHGGGFVQFSAGSKMFDNFQTTAAVEIPAVLVSIEYRLAPEHRLPAAYDDSVEVLHWIKNSRDEWFSKYADLSNTFLMGSSAGGNILYQVALRAASSADNLKPLNIKGLIFHQPFFGGIKWTQSELRSVDDKYLPYHFIEVLWELGLPIGVDRDHEYCNPVACAKSVQFDQIKALGWKILIAGHEGDTLIDRQIEFLKMLQENGVQAVAKFQEGGYHGIEAWEPLKCKEFCELAKEFVISCMVA